MGLVAIALVVDRATYVPATGDVWVNVGLVVAYPAAGALILWNRPGHRVGLLLTVVGLCCALTLASHAIAIRGVVLHPGSIPGAAGVVWLNGWIWTTGTMPAVALLPALFPDGRLANLPAKLAVYSGLAAIALLAIGAAFVPGRFDQFPSVRNPMGIDALEAVLRMAQGAGFLLFLFSAACSLMSVHVRWRHADEAGRRQLKWFLSATAFLVVSVLLNATGVTTSTIGAGTVAIAPVLMAVAVVTAIVREGLYDIDPIVNRSVVYTVLTAIWVALYSVGLAVLGAAFGRFGALALSSAVIAVAFDPLRTLVQRLVDRMLYGDRSGIDKVIGDLARRLVAATEPASALRAVTDAAVAALGSPGAVATITSHGAVVAQQTTGDIGGVTERHPIMLRGTPVGELAVAVRRGDERPSRRRRRLLTDAWQRLLQSAELAASTVLLTADLQRARVEAVAAREEERRRIRRDLHDGLGARLAGLALGIESVDPSKQSAADKLHHLAIEAYATIDEVRTLVHDLRPSALDDLGLVRALRERGDALMPPGAATRFEISASTEVEALPAAVEVAAFRIGSEAMTNVVRHAAATSCVVQVALTPTELVVSVDDDGIGIDGGTSGSGVGVDSMRERAIEVGGTLSITDKAPHGTSVVARLPRCP